jgi:hypothetical protein
MANRNRWPEPMTDRYPRAYAMLKRAGFSPAKALEVLFDAERGDRYALDVIRALRHGLGPQVSRGAAPK